MKKHPILVTFLILVAVFFFFISIIFVAVLMSGSKSFHNEPIAVVKIEGPILESLDILQDLEELYEDEHVKVIVLRIDSPGGAVAPSQEIYEQILRIKENKKVIVSMGTVAASGGYYIACAADKIVASSGSITGSIGVIMESLGLQNVVKKIEVEPRVIKSGEYKNVGNPFFELTERDRQYLQSIIDNLYDQFLDAVSKNRKIPLEKIKTIAQGKIYTGLQAKEVHLIDEIGNIYDAIQLAKTEAGLPDDAKVRWPEEPTFIERLFEGNNAESLLQSVFEKFGESFLPLWSLKSKALPQYQLQ